MSTRKCNLCGLSCPIHPYYCNLCWDKRINENVTILVGEIQERKRVK